MGMNNSTATAPAPAAALAAQTAIATARTAAPGPSMKRKISQEIMQQRIDIKALSEKIQDDLTDLRKARDPILTHAIIERINRRAAALATADMILFTLNGILGE